MVPDIFEGEGLTGVDGYTINKLSEITGLDRRGLTRLLENTEPAEVRGRSKLYTVRQVIESIRGPSATAEKARLDKLRADVVELDLGVKRGALIPTETVLDALMPLFSNVRTKLLAIPTKAAPLVMACKTKLEAQGAIKTLIYDTLDELANTDGLVVIGDNAAKIASAAAGLDSESVGGQVQKAKRGKQRGAGAVVNK